MLKLNLVSTNPALDNEVVYNGVAIRCTDSVAEVIAKAIEEAFANGEAVMGESEAQPKAEVKATAKPKATTKSTTKSASSKKSGEVSKFEAAGGRPKYEQIAEKLGVLYEDKNGSRKVARQNRPLVYSVMYGEMTLTAAKKAVKERA